jgi:GNAT superfamily N-acetyltransferase
MTDEPGPAIRRARLGEGPELTELALRSKAHWGYDAAFMADVREELTFREEKFLPDFHVYVLEEAGRRLGFCSLRPIDTRTVELDDLFVEPKDIGRGHGRLLFEHAARVASGLGYETLRIVSEPFAEPFYRKRGARVVSEKESTIRPGRTLPVMEYPLRSSEHWHGPHGREEP